MLAIQGRGLDIASYVAHFVGNTTTITAYHDTSTNPPFVTSCASARERNMCVSYHCIGLRGLLRLSTRLYHAPPENLCCRRLPSKSSESSLRLFSEHRIPNCIHSMLVPPLAPAPPALATDKSPQIRPARISKTTSVLLPLQKWKAYLTITHAIANLPINPYFLYGPISTSAGVRKDT